MTNSDIIRNMTDEELAALLEAYICNQVNECQIVEFFDTKADVSYHIHNKGTWDKKCSDCVLEWLKQEVGSEREKMEKIPFIVALAVGGVMEHPDYVYEDKQVIWACDEKEAVRIYNENNNCSYYYGEVIGIARDQMY